MTTGMTPLQDVLLDALRGAKGWITRKGVSNAIGRPNRLNPHDIVMLERLVDAGIVKRSQRIRPGTTVQQEYIYRIVD